IVSCRQAIKLILGKRRSRAEQRIRSKKHSENPNREMYQRTSDPFGGSNQPDHVDVCDSIRTGDVISRADRALFDQDTNDPAKILCVEGLAHKPSIARDRKDRAPLHETRKPSEMLGVKPTVHECWAKNSIADTGSLDDRLL